MFYTDFHEYSKKVAFLINKKKNEAGCVRFDMVCNFLKISSSMLCFLLRNKVPAELHIDLASCMQKKHEIFQFDSILKTCDEKFCLKFFTLTAVSFDSCQTEKFGLTAVKLKNFKLDFAL